MLNLDDGLDLWLLGPDLYEQTGTSVPYKGNTFLAVGGYNDRNLIYEFRVDEQTLATSWYLRPERITTPRGTPAAFLIPDDFAVCG